MQFNFSYDPGTSLNHMLAFEVAGQVWGSYLQDDVTVNLHVGVTDAEHLPDSVIGGALPGMAAEVRYEDFRDRYWRDVTSAADHSANNTLAWDNWLKYEQFFDDGYNGGEWVNNETISMTRANAKALGLTDAHAGLDGYILMSDLDGQGVDWDVTTQTAESGKLDLLSTALHEVGHALGFVSGIDQPGWLSAKFETDYTNYETDYEAFVADYWEDINDASTMMRERAKYATTLDKFRHSANSDGESDYTYGSEFSEKYFSIDGGTTSLASFSSGADESFGGDGYQASHWKQQGNAIGIMDPTLALGERSEITTLDLTALDVIGWDIQSSGVNTTINLAAFENQARANLANRLGQSTTWLQNNEDAAANQLSEVRVQDVLTMALESQVYDLSWLNPEGSDSYWLNWANNVGGDSYWVNWWNNTGGDSYWVNWWNQEGGSGWWQMMEQLFQQRGLFSRLEGVPTDSVDEAAMDAITGVPLAEGAAAVPGLSDASSAPHKNEPAELENFTQYSAEAQEGISGQGTLDDGGNLGSLSLEASSGQTTNLLNDGLSGLGQDQLLGVTGLSALNNSLI